jgi:hypothetical protein
VSAGPDAGSRRPWWRDVATIVAVTGLLVTLIFNTIGVWRAERETSKARVATEVNLLTQVGEGANRASQALVASGANDQRCKRAVGLSLSDPQQSQLFSALTYYDYLAWLFNDGHVTLQSAKAYWGPDIVDVYDLGRKFVGTEVDALFRNLSRFARAAPEEFRPGDVCE